MTKNPKVNKSFSNANNWVGEANLLREILLECNLTEEIKWRSPCYTHNGKNICIIQRMASFVSLLFFNCVLLKDPDDLLEPPGLHSGAGYLICFSNVEDILTATRSIKAYVQEAIEIEKTGLKVRQQNDFKYPRELIAKFNADLDYRAAFNNLSPRRQCGYIKHFSDAKKSKTRTARIKRCRQQIFDGKGLFER